MFKRLFSPKELEESPVKQKYSESKYDYTEDDIPNAFSSDFEQANSADAKPPPIQPQITKKKLINVANEYVKPTKPQTPSRHDLRSK